MKKYPVTYKGEIYEVRWEQSGWLECIAIYKETTTKFLKRRTYKQVFSIYEYIIDRYSNHISENNPNYYIEQAKTIFKLWEQEIESGIKTKLTKQKQKQTLAEWDGFIK